MHSYDRVDEDENVAGFHRHLDNPWHFIHAPALADRIAMQPCVGFIGVEEGFWVALLIVLKGVLDVAFVRARLRPRPPSRVP